MWARVGWEGSDGLYLNMRHPSEDVWNLLAKRVWNPGDSSGLENLLPVGPQCTVHQWEKARDGPDYKEVCSTRGNSLGQGPGEHQHLGSQCRRRRKKGVGRSMKERRRLWSQESLEGKDSRTHGPSGGLQGRD